MAGKGKADVWTGGSSRRPSTPQFDLGGYAVGGILDLLAGAGGQYVPGSGGGVISRAAERAAAQAAYNQAEANRAAVYGDAVAKIGARNPVIQSGYQQATDTLRNDARARAIADRTALSQRQEEATNAAAAYGLNAAPSATERTSEVVEENAGRYQGNAESWAGFNSGASQRAVERNNAVADTFTWQGAQQQAALAQMLQMTLAGLQDQYYGGSSGGYVGGLSNSQQLSALNSLLGYSDKDFDNDLNAAQFGLAGQRLNLDRQKLALSAAKSGF